MCPKIINLNIFYQLKLNQKLPNHFLLVGEKTLLIKKATLLIKNLLCPQNGECGGICRTCLRVDNRDYDLFFILQLAPTESIKKDDLSALFAWLQNTKLNSHYRIYYVPDIDRLTVAASNSLLKFLETPHDNCLGVFTTSSPQTLLPTISSRLQTFYLHDDVSLPENKNKDNHSLMNDNRHILQLINWDCYRLDTDFLNKYYLPLQILVKKFLFLIDKQDLSKFYLLENEKLLIGQFWLFLEILIINLQTLIKKRLLVSSVNFFAHGTLKMINILDACWQIFSQNAYFYQISRNHLNEKNTFLYLVDSVNRLV